MLAFHVFSHHSRLQVSISPAVHKNVDLLLGQHLDEKGTSAEQAAKSPVNAPQDWVPNSLPERFPVSDHVLQLRNKNLQEKQKAWQVVIKICYSHGNVTLKAGWRRCCSRRLTSGMVSRILQRDRR